MPLEDNAYTRGKWAFKLIQYMSGGLPIIGSNVGFNKTVVDKEIGALANNSAKSAWLDALLMMVKNGHIHYQLIDNETSIIQVMDKEELK